MKKSILLLVFVIPFFWKCEKSEPEKMSLNIISADWYTTTSTFNKNTFCEIHLKISGSTNAALLSVETYGDGTRGCVEIISDSDSKFNTDVVIKFFPINAFQEEKYSTVLIAYSSRNKPDIVFCDATGSGDTITKRLVSRVLICN
jgi:electron transfer flavoprotein alpha subunit